MTYHDSKLLRMDAIEGKPIIRNWLDSEQPILFYHSPPPIPPLLPAVEQERKPHYQYEYVLLQGGRRVLH